ncbi:MAG TPA: hypothetical protein VMS17_00975 [Gemmataceae bacterium]|nr:hypothetical protein [Gemmataceae bacterium]
MKHCTRDLVERYGSPDDAVARAADAEWEAVLERYEQGLQPIEAQLPEHIRVFTRLLHGALVLSVARQDDKLILVLRKDIPPRDVVILTYTLIAEPVIDREALSPDRRTSAMEYLYDEFELIRERGRQTYAQSMLFGNGWELSLGFSDVQVSVGEPVYPPPGVTFIPAPSSAAGQPV